MVTALQGNIMSGFVYAYVAKQGYGPYYQRAAWDYIKNFPAPGDSLGWTNIMYALDQYVESGFGIGRD